MLKAVLLKYWSRRNGEIKSTIRSNRGYLLWHVRCKKCGMNSIVLILVIS